MRHAGPNDLARLEGLLGRIRSLGVFNEPRPGCFYRKGRAALHFHEDGGALYADMRLQGAAFQRRPVGTPASEAALLAEIAGAALSAG